MSARKVRVVVADDHPLFREGVVRALSASGQVEVVAEAGDGQAALAAIGEHAPDVALVDYRLPELDGIGVIQALANDGSESRVLLVTAHDDSALVYRALELGAAGYLLKDARREAIVDAVLACARGEAVIPQALAAGLVSELRAQRAGERVALTEREREVLALVAAGNSVPQIAGTLHLGATTVKTHLQRVYEKLGVSDRAAAVAEGMRRHLIE